jgi:hypothetical protein
MHVTIHQYLAELSGKRIKREKEKKRKKESKRE